MLIHIVHLLQEYNGILQKARNISHDYACTFLLALQPIVGLYFAAL